MKLWKLNQGVFSTTEDFSSKSFTNFSNNFSNKSIINVINLSIRLINLNYPCQNSFSALWTLRKYFNSEKEKIFSRCSKTPNTPRGFKQEFLTDRLIKSYSVRYKYKWRLWCNGSTKVCGVFPERKEEMQNTLGEGPIPSSRPVFCDSNQVGKKE